LAEVRIRGHEQVRFDQERLTLFPLRLYSSNISGL